MSLCFLSRCLGVKTNPEEYAWNPVVIFDIKSPFAHTFQQFVAHACTILGICGIFAVTVV